LLKNLEIAIRTRVTVGVAVATCCVVSLLSGQTAPDIKEARTWRLEGLRNGYCVRFLVEPEAASKELKSGFTLVPASQDSFLHPALQQLIGSQPEYATWSASKVCLYYLDAVQVGKRRIAERNPRNYQLLGVWTIATLEQRGTRRDLVLDLYASRENLLNAAEIAHVRLHEIHSSYYDHPDTTSDVYSLKIGKTQLIWSGRPAGDSTRVERPITEQWSVSGLRHGIQNAELIVAPTWSRGFVGSLQVEGKGDLAKVLRASPIRFVGPLYRGGAGELRFSR
jgi:hypothetical protein